MSDDQTFPYTVNGYCDAKKWLDENGHVETGDDDRMKGIREIDLANKLIAQESKTMSNENMITISGKANTGKTFKAIAVGLALHRANQQIKQLSDSQAIPGSLVIFSTEVDVPQLKEIFDRQIGHKDVRDDSIVFGHGTTTLDLIDTFNQVEHCGVLVVDQPEMLCGPRVDVKTNIDEWVDEWADHYSTLVVTKNIFKSLRNEQENKKLTVTLIKFDQKQPYSGLVYTYENCKGLFDDNGRLKNKADKPLAVFPPTGGRVFPTAEARVSIPLQDICGTLRNIRLNDNKTAIIGELSIGGPRAEEIARGVSEEEMSARITPRTLNIQIEQGAINRVVELVCFDYQTEMDGELK